MSTVLELHRQAMEYADAALIARHDLDHALAKKYYYEALQYERKAAEMVVNDITNEPTRSVLHRSAASMAINCGELREAERLITNALEGNPPQEIAEELNDLLKEVNLKMALAAACGISEENPRELLEQ